MESMVSQIQSILKKHRSVIERQNHATGNILKLIEELREKGVLKKPEYNLPMRDTIGRSVYKSMQAQKSI